MASAIAIVAALPREIHGLVKGAKPDRLLRSSGIMLYRLERSVVVSAGMGAARVSLAFEAALQTMPFDTVFSIGLGGACDPAVSPGSVLEASQVVDVKTGERFETAGPPSTAVLASTPSIASVAEKARLHAAYRAQVVDMEAGTVARLAQAQGVSFRAIKGISDAPDFEISFLSQFSDARGQFRTGAFALHTALRPWQWRKVMTLGRNSQHALEKLTERLNSVLAETA